MDNLVGILEPSANSTVATQYILLSAHFDTGELTIHPATLSLGLI